MEDFPEIGSTKALYIDLSQLKCYIWQDADYVAVSEDGGVLQFSAASGFPLLGKENILYIDTGTTSAYFWDRTTLRYICIANGATEINEIDGGHANG